MPERAIAYTRYRNAPTSKIPIAPGFTVARYYSVTTLSAHKAPIIIAHAARFSQLKGPIDNLIYFEHAGESRVCRVSNRWKSRGVLRSGARMNYEAHRLRIHAR